VCRAFWHELLRRKRRDPKILGTKLAFSQDSHGIMNKKANARIIITIQLNFLIGKTSISVRLLNQDASFYA